MLPVPVKSMELHWHLQLAPEVPGSLVPKQSGNE
jgi:hypothetical protein